MASELDVVGIGNALVDVLVETDVSTVEAQGLVKGSMVLMGLEDAERIHAGVGAGMERSGGSAANTMAGLACLGGRAGFIGRVGEDRLGRVFTDDIGNLGVVFSRSQAAEGATGRCLILITPDADRTMCTSLGVSAGFDSEDLDVELITRAQLTYLEGYLFDEPAAKAAFHQAIDVAHAAGRNVAMSLSDPFCVERHRDDFAKLVATKLDILFANEAEVCVLTGDDDVVAACNRLRRSDLTVTVTLGASGALAFSGDGPTIRCPAVPVGRVEDTTGAGDLYAAGFLYGYTRGCNLERCIRLGAISAGEIISHVGARPEADLRAMVAHVLNS